MRGRPRTKPCEHKRDRQHRTRDLTRDDRNPKDTCVRSDDCHPMAVYTKPSCTCGGARSTSGADLSAVARPVAAERYVRHTVKEPYFAIASNGCCTMQPVWQGVAPPGRTQIFSWGQANVQLQMHARCWLSHPLWTRMRVHGLCYQAQDAQGTSRAVTVHGMHHFRKQPLRRIGCSMAEQPRSTP